jgi:hypothetical protein
MSALKASIPREYASSSAGTAAVSAEGCGRVRVLVIAEGGSESGTDALGTID